MSKTPTRVTVVGAGIVGLSAAWFLQSEGADVSVIDRTGVAAGSSWGNAGWLAPALTLPLAEPAVLAAGIRDVMKPSSPVFVPLTADAHLLRFLTGFIRQCSPRKWERAMSTFAEINRHSLNAFDELAAGGVAEPVHEARPLLAAFGTAKDRDAMIQELSHASELGHAASFASLDENETLELEPALGAGVHAGVRIEGQRFINPGRFVNALADAVRVRGATTRFGVAVDSIEEISDGVRIRMADGETFTTDAVVVATGTWLGKLTRPFGVRTVVQAGRGYSFTVDPEVMPSNPIYFPTQRVACTPLDPGFRVAGMMEFRRPDAPLDTRRIDAIIEAVRPMLRGVNWEARTDEWVGSRPCTSDGLPLIGPTKSARVHVAGGHGMWGVVLGPLSGRLVARSLLGNERHDLMRHFDPLR